MISKEGGRMSNSIGQDGWQGSRHHKPHEVATKGKFNFDNFLSFIVVDLFSEMEFFCEENIQSLY